MKKVTCQKCKKEVDETLFSFKNKSLGVKHKQCKKCVRRLIKSHYLNNKHYYLKKAKNRNNELRQGILEYINQFLSKHPCVDCGESDIVVLEFDHISKNNKTSTVSQLIRLRQPITIIRKEIDKCEVRCANCHRRKTARDFKWGRIKRPL